MKTQKEKLNARIAKCVKMLSAILVFWAAPVLFKKVEIIYNLYEDGLLAVGALVLMFMAVITVSISLLYLMVQVINGFKPIQVFLTKKWYGIGLYFGRIDFSLKKRILKRLNQRNTFFSLKCFKA